MLKHVCFVIGLSNFEGEEVSLGRSSSSNKDLEVEPERVDIYAENPAGALQDIAFKCGAKVLEIKCFSFLWVNIRFIYIN